MDAGGMRADNRCMPETDPELVRRVVYGLLLAVLLGFMGMAVIIALLATWRNYYRRQRLLEKGRTLRKQFRGEATASPIVDAWRESGQRYREEEPEEDQPPDRADSPDDDSPPPPAGPHDEPERPH